MTFLPLVGRSARLGMLAMMTFSTVLMPMPSWAQKYLSLQSEVNSYNQHGICIKGETIELLTSASHCPYYCQRIWTCVGPEKALPNPCNGSNVSRADCNTFIAGHSSCQKEMNEINKMIFEYNTIIAKCRSGKKTTAPDKPANKPPDLQKELDKTLAEARQAAANASAAAKAAVTEKTVQLKQKIASAKVSVSNACMERVNSCWQSIDTELSATTVQMCEVHCTNMQAENCNPKAALTFNSGKRCADMTAREHRDRAEAQRQAEQEAQAQEEERNLSPEALCDRSNRGRQGYCYCLTDKVTGDRPIESERANIYYDQCWRSSNKPNVGE